MLCYAMYSNPNDFPSFFVRLRIVIVAVVFAFLEGSLSDSAGVVEAGLGAIWNLTYRSDGGMRLSGDSGTCEGE